MEDEHRLRERVEISLDNRQIFLLFVASAAVVSLVFALGVVVGKRLTGGSELSGARRPTDPLALLDQMGSSEPTDEDLTFHDKLTRKPKPAQGADASSGAPDDAEPSPKPSPASGNAPDKAAPPPVKPPPAPAPAKPAKATEMLAKAPKPKKASPAPVGDAAKAKRPEAPSLKGPVGDGQRYTLQLSSFQDRSEAERFMDKLRAGGLKPTIVPTRIPNRGLWYRVRIGDYMSWEQAVAAKQRFEQTQQVIAYVARR